MLYVFNLETYKYVCIRLKDNVPEEAMVLGANAPKAARSSRSVAPGGRRAEIRGLVAERERDVGVALLIRVAPQAHDELVALVGELGHFRPREPVQYLSTSENCERLDVRLRTKFMNVTVGLTCVCFIKVKSKFTPPNPCNQPQTNLSRILGISCLTCYSSCGNADHHVVHDPSRADPVQRQLRGRLQVAGVRPLPRQPRHCLAVNREHAVDQLAALGPDSFLSFGEFLWCIIGRFF